MMVSSACNVQTSNRFQSKCQNAPDIGFETSVKTRLFSDSLSFLAVWSGQTSHPPCRMTDSNATITYRVPSYFGSEFQKCNDTTPAVTQAFLTWDGILTSPVCQECCTLNKPYPFVNKQEAWRKDEKSRQNDTSWFLCFTFVFNRLRQILKVTFKLRQTRDPSFTPSELAFWLSSTETLWLILNH